MSREIKFRCWDKIIKQMFVPSMINMHGDVRHMGISSSDNNFRNKGEKFDTWLLKERDGHSFEIMQSTSLKDKNGKEIYEGDIVKNEDAGGGESEVVFENGCFCLKSPWMKEQSHLQLRYYTQFYELKGARIDCMPLEVIGNIYENQDLLK